VSNGNAQIVSVSGKEVTEGRAPSSVSARFRQATPVASTPLDHWALGWIQRTVSSAPIRFVYGGVSRHTNRLRNNIVGDMYNVQRTVECVSEFSGIHERVLVVQGLRRVAGEREREPSGRHAGAR
jgi:hypothetical protein